MLIAIDARTIYAVYRRGTGKTLISLYSYVAAMRPEWQFLMLHRGQGLDDPFANLANVENRRIEIKGDRLDLWQQVRLPLAAKMARADFLHCPANTGPRWLPVPIVLTIHDLIPLDPRFATAQSKRWGKNVAAVAKKAQRIIVPSEFSKRQIIETFEIPSNKIIVNHWAANPMCQPVTDVQEQNRVRIKYGLEPDCPYVLGFGGFDRRKNTERIIEAWASMPEHVLKSCSLLIVGIPEPLLTRFRQKAVNAGIERSCSLQGYVSEDDLMILLSGAQCLCYPSLSEGFGLPVLDAFACETAVLTSNVTSLPEIAGDAAMLVDPNETAAIADGLRVILEDRRVRDELVRRGRERLRLFTWEGCAERFCSVLEELL